MVEPKNVRRSMKRKMRMKTEMKMRGRRRRKKTRKRMKRSSINLLKCKKKRRSVILEHTITTDHLQ